MSITFFFLFFVSLRFERNGRTGSTDPLPWLQVLVAQWIAHQTSNLGVAGSNPVEYALFFFAFLQFATALGPRGAATGFQTRLYSSVGRACAS